MFHRLGTPKLTRRDDRTRAHQTLIGHCRVIEANYGHRVGERITPSANGIRSTSYTGSLRGLSTWVPGPSKQSHACPNQPNASPDPELPGRRFPRYGSTGFSSDSLTVWEGGTGSDRGVSRETLPMETPPGGFSGLTRSLQPWIRGSLVYAASLCSPSFAPYNATADPL